MITVRWMPARRARRRYAPSGAAVSQGPVRPSPGPAWQWPSTTIPPAVLSSATWSGRHVSVAAHGRRRSPADVARPARGRHARWRPNPLRTAIERHHVLLWHSPGEPDGLGAGQPLLGEVGDLQEQGLELRALRLQDVRLAEPAEEL